MKAVYRWGRPRKTAVPLSWRRRYHISSHAISKMNESNKANISGPDDSEVSRRKWRHGAAFPQRLAKIREKWSLNDSFMTHRDNIINILQNDANVKGLFQNGASSSLEHVSTYAQLQEKLGSTTYYQGEMEANLLLLCQLLLNSIIVEINVRMMFLNDDIPQKESYLFQNFINGITNEAKKAQILKILLPLYQSVDSAKPANFQDFFENLDKISVDALLESFALNDSFNDLETYRYLFQHYKSSDYLNYDISDLVLSVKSRNYIKFSSPQISNDEYIAKLEETFQQYQQYKAREELMKSDKNYMNYVNDKSLENFESLNEIYKNYVVNVPRVQHVQLGLSIVKILLTSNTHAPDYKLFKYLLDKLGDLQLFNYQSLVYKCLPLYIYKPSVLAEGSQLEAYHFQSLVEQNPEILSSLILYSSKRQDLDTFKQILSFYQLDDIIESEGPLNKSYLQSILSKSRFIRHRERKLNLPEIDFNTAEPIFVSQESIYTTMECCIRLKQYQYIDLLFNKILIHSVETDDRLKIALSLGVEPTENLLLSKDYPPQKIAGKIFTKQLFKLLIQASRESDDLGRLMWILPHLDDYLTQQLKHIDDIVAECQNENSAIDKELIEEIYNTLLMFGLEGKVIAYDDLLHFNKSITSPK